jgi:hypothetical protein
LKGRGGGRKVLETEPNRNSIIKIPVSVYGRNECVK